MKKIFIKCFETPKNKYFYDRYLNSIVRVTDSEFEELKIIEKTGRIPDENLLHRFIEMGLLHETILNDIEHPETENLEMLSNHYIEYLILQVTQQCNLRCKYCAYSGNYYNREHSSERMSFDIAKKAIDFYLERSDSANELCLGFYGGEPLLEYELIKKCVDYIKNQGGDKPIRFPMTTNGTLLSDEVIKFIVQHQFTLMISLDGNRESHNANRKYATGFGTFDTILKNLKALKEYDEKYYQENVMFNCVINSETNLAETYRFYAESDLFSPDKIHFNFVDPVDIKDDSITHLSIHNKRVDSLAYIKMALAVLGKRKWDNYSLMMRDRMVDVELMYQHVHKHSPENTKLHHGGPCIPGVRRLFVNVNGRFYPCERVSESDEEMCIGSLEQGFNYKNMDFLINHGKIVKNECMSCWNLRNCSFCLNSVSKENHHLTKEMLQKMCSESRQRSLVLLYKLCILVELGYEGNENLNVYK